MRELRKHLLMAALLTGAAVMGTSALAQPAEGSSQPAATPEAAATAEPQATAPATTGRVPAPPEGKGQIVFFRPSRLAGAALSFSVHEGDAGVGKLGNGSYFVLAADPGPHAYSIQSEAKDTLNVEVEPGETLYVQQTIGVGIMMGRPHLTPSDAATFERLKLKLSTKAASDLKSKSGA